MASRLRPGSPNVFPDTLPAWFARVARAFPSRIAVTGAGVGWTYAELDARSNRIAHLLARHGVRRETPVALVLERTPELVAAILGILKAGGTYVPVDLSYPAERVEFLLNDSEAPVVLTQRSLAERLPAQAAQVLCLDDASLALEGLSAEPAAVGGTPDDSAYIIYTSGSTGQPKGCCVTHHNVIRLFTATQPWFNFNEGDVWTLFHSAAFDFSVWEMWGALLHGGRLVVVPYLTSRAPDDFLRLLAQEQVTVLNQTPSAFRQLVAAEGDLAGPPPLALRYVIFGGEALELRSLRPWFDRHGDKCPQLVNMYGITETTVHVTYRPLTAHDLGRGSVIGVPIPDLQLHVLDAHMRECPPGEPGEIFVGGAGVARGYLNRPELTAERFVPSPFAAGERLYRSGDLARRLPDGDLEYLGRMDHQVKVRGFRVELGEIESALTAHPAIREAVALARDGGGDKELTAYLVLTGAPPTFTELRESLRRTLPDYMVPAAFFVVPQIPLTPNGKTDRAALAQSNGEELGTATHCVAPRSTLEEQLAQIWRTVLRRERVGVDDDFFQIGGHSLLAMQVTGRVTSLLRRAVPVTLLFQHPTLAAYASAISAGTAAALPGTARLARGHPVPCGQWVGIPAQSDAGSSRPELCFPLSPMQQALLFNSLRHPDSGAEILQMEWRVAGESEPQRLLAAARRLAEHDDLLRAALRWEGVAQPVHEIQSTIEVELVTHDLRPLPAAEREAAWRELLAADRRRGFDLRQAPLWRLKLVRETEAGARVLFTIHHAITDGRSLILLLRDLGKGVADLGSDRAMELPARRPFKDFIAWLGHSNPAATEAFWRDALAGARIPTPLQLGDPPDEPPGSFAFRESVPASLDAALTRRVRSLAAELDVTFNTLVQGAWALALSQATRESEVVFGVTRACRKSALAEGPDMTGVFINSLPLRVAVTETDRLAPWLRALRGQQLAVRPHEHTPLSRLQEWCAGGRPLFESLVMFDGADLAAQLHSAGADWAAHEAVLHQMPGPALTLVAYDGEALEANVYYDPSRFSQTAVAACAAHWGAVLAAIAQRPEATLGEIQAQARSHAAAAGLPRLPKSLLSAEEQRMWFLDQTLPDRTAYNVPLAVRLLGPLDVPGLERALNAVAARHEILRTRYLVREGAPCREVLPSPAARVMLTDLSATPESRRGEITRDQVAALLATPFDLAAAPPWRMTCLRFAAEEHVLVLVAHHIICDEWSLRLWFSELETHHAAGGDGCLPALPAQYADYARSQAERLRQPDMDAHRTYWQQQLAGVDRLLELPGDQPPPAQSTLRGALATLSLAQVTTRKLEALARSQDATWFMALTAVWQTLLHRWSGQTDVVVAVPVAQRNQAEVESLIGCFLNTLPLRARLEPAMSFRTLLDQVRATVLAAIEHSSLPFDEIVRLSNCRAAGQSPLAQVMLAPMNDLPRALDLPGVRSEVLVYQPATAKCDLTLFVYERADGDREAGLEYSLDRFTPATAARLLAQFRQLLESAAAEPDQAISRLNLLSEREHELLREWNASEHAYPDELCLHQLFEQQADRTPHAIALRARDRALTYRELDRHANALAQELNNRGLTRGTLVGICAGRCPELLVAMLAVLKAGGAYVPIDPNYPKDRIAYILNDAVAPLLLTQRSLEGLLPAGASNPHVFIDDVLRFSADRADAGSQPRDLAYVIYTSGSTGSPKGVAIEHHSAFTLIAWAQSVYQPAELAGVLFSTSICFDLSIFELFVTLASGGSVILAENALDLLNHPQCHSITLINTVPSAITELLDAGLVPSSVKVVNLAGEPLTASLSDRIYRTIPGVKVYDLYGPSEDTTYSTFALRQPGGRATIGRPIANTRAHVVDSSLQLVPVGMAGELLLAGEGLARGYLNRPELTAEKFIQHPDFGRVYRTGDRARWTHDGNLEYLGRMDRQLKIRGFRIEPGEIEAVLAAHPDVAACAVVPRRRGGTDTTLAAFLVPRGSASLPDALGWRRWLAQRLPEHLIPAHFAIIESLPLSPNGKIDRNALETRDSEDLPAARFQPPATQREILLASIWQDVLQIPQIGLHDDFFALGGHSLLAMRVAARLTRALGVEVPLRRLLESPTVAGLAAVLAPAGGATASAAIHPVPRRGPLPVSREQERLWFLQQVLAEPSAYNVALAARLTGPLDLARLEHSWQQLVARHEILRMRFIEADGVIRQIPCELGAPLVSIEDLRSLPDAARAARVEALLRAEAATPFDLATAPLFRVKCLRLGEAEHVLAVTCHHLLCDEWSMAVLFDELATLYREDGKALAELPVQYADYAAWQYERLARDAFAAQRDYWREQLADAPEALELPADHARPPRASGRGGQVSFRVEPEPTQALGGLAREEGATPFMAWLAVFAAFLHRLSAQADLLVGTPFAQRRLPEVQGLPGFFLNTLPIRSRIRPGTGFRELLRATRATVLAAFDHGELPFDEIARLSADARAAGGPALLHTLFVMLDGPPASLHLPGLQTEPVVIPAETAKFDLSFFLYASANGGLEGLLEFSADLVTRASAERWAAQFRQLAGALAAAPDAAIEHLDWLPPEQRKQVVEEFNQTQLEFALPGGVHEWFEAQARRTPTAVAIRYGEVQLSYEQLDIRASELARHLRGLGVQADSLVGLCLERSPDLVVAVLAAMKAGGACLPLDPEYPAERLRSMLQDAQPTVLVTQTDLAARLPEHAAPRVLLDTWKPARDLADAQPAGTARERLAYVLFTSGSTGRPKGVALPQRALLNLIAWQRGESSCGVGDRTLQFASLSFDVSFQEIFATLGTGGTLVLVSESTRRDLPALARVIREQRVARIFVPFVVLDDLARLLVEDGAGGLALKEVVTAGEQLRVTPALVELFTRLPQAKLINQYGPTETHVVTAFTLPDMPASWPALPPIGRPIANTRIYVLDESGRPVPMGVPGELCVGGVQVARGYLDQPELTDERFIPDPFSPLPDARLYRTGDRCRWRSDGLLEYLGRGDDQVKVRGFRVELGEVEAVLTAQPAVRQAAVIGLDGAGSVTGLAAFLVLREGANWDEQQARATLRARLPDYMVPSRFVAVDGLPLSPNGKVDRRALTRRGELESAPVTHTPLAPRNETEAGLVAVWEEVLGRRPVGVADNFFDLGGHSLLAMRLTRAMEARFGRRLPLASLFAAPTVEELARVLAVPQAAMPRTGTARLRGQGNGAPWFHIPGIAGFEFLPLAVAARTGTMRRFYDGLEYPGLDGLSAPLTRVEDIAAHLIRQMEQVAPGGPYCLSGYSFGGVVAYEMARQLAARGTTVEAVLLWDSFAPAAFRKRSAIETLRVLGQHLAGLGHRERARFLGRQALKKVKFLSARAARKLPSLSSTKPPAEAVAANASERNAQAQLTEAALDAYRTYRPGAYAGKVVVFQVEEREFNLGFRHAPDAYNGWRGLAQGGVEIVRVPGNHNTLLEEPAVSVLAQRLVERLESMQP